MRFTHSLLWGALVAAMAMGVAEPACASDAALIQQILNAKGGVSERSTAVHALGFDLADSQIKTLCRFLTGLPGKDEDNLAALDVLKNDLSNVLMEQARATSNLLQSLQKITVDSRQDLITRDYALQHLVTLIQRGMVTSAAEKIFIHQTLQNSLHEKNRLAGTALLGLHRITGEKDSSSRMKLKELSLAMAGNSVDLTSQITAVQACAEQKFPETLSLVRQLAENSHSTPLRISAIGALGLIGQPQDIFLLQRLKNASDHALAPALEAALLRLRPKFQSDKVVSNLE